MPQENNVLERAASLAKENLNKIQAPAREKAAEESKIASENKAKAEEQKKKDEGIKIAEAEAQAKEDERILNVEDKNLSEPELKRKADLKEVKRKKDDSPDEKIKRVQESTQKRIDEIKSELLAEREKSKSETEALKAELELLKKPKEQEDVKAKVKRIEAERFAKYVDEDKSKPREDRREMSKDDLDEWYLEDPIEATRWIRRNENFREKERNSIEEDLKPKVDTKKLVEDFISKQNESKTKLFDKYPGTNPSKEKITELMSKAKDKAELNELLRKDNEEFRLCSEIVAEDPKKYLESVNGPELIMAEMEKRLKSPNSGKIELTQEELDAKIQAEIDRRSLIDGEGVTSTKGKKVENKDPKKSNLRQEQEKLASKAKLTTEQYDAMLKRRQTIPGAGTFTDDKDD